jgi:hypothetical protein
MDADEAVKRLLDDLVATTDDDITELVYRPDRSPASRAVALLGKALAEIRVLEAAARNEIVLPQLRDIEGELACFRELRDALLEAIRVRYVTMEAHGEWLAEVDRIMRVN